MFETDAELWSALQQMSRTVNQVVAASKPIAKALDKMGDVASLNRQDYVADALNAIQHADLAPYGGADSYAALIRGLEDRLRTLRTTARQDLIAGLNATAPKPDQIKMVSDSPLVLYVHPLTLEVNFEQCKTTWSYAREPMAQSSLDPSDIWNVYGELLDQFRAARIDSKSFWQALKAAYDIVLLKHGKPAGERYRRCISADGVDLAACGSTQEGDAIPAIFARLSNTKVATRRAHRTQRIPARFGYGNGREHEKQGKCALYPDGTDRGTILFDDVFPTRIEWRAFLPELLRISSPGGVSFLGI